MLEGFLDSLQRHADLLGPADPNKGGSCFSDVVSQFEHSNQSEGGVGVSSTDFQIEESSFVRSQLTAPMRKIKAQRTSRYRIGVFVST